MCKSHREKQVIQVRRVENVDLVDTCSLKNPREKYKCLVLSISYLGANARGFLGSNISEDFNRSDKQFQYWCTQVTALHNSLIINQWAMREMFH